MEKKNKERIVIQLFLWYLSKIECEITSENLKNKLITRFFKGDRW